MSHHETNTNSIFHNLLSSDSDLFHGHWYFDFHRDLCTGKTRKRKSIHQNKNIRVVVPDLALLLVLKHFFHLFAFIVTMNSTGRQMSMFVRLQS
jgi:hypothetical protein